ncbi:hypothetical protein CH63R_03103 [Colletotrichum higginsianum IMI 349063]|uniref:Uncharacterized protein n=1 Tax=Colletotrichum higginsianum (strain IMI 349063) TaxID=759273 RepID=A0A1B7YQR5_COLHI|nr:hypothetical protein CH63R_03103 [Colletotrichum higginsianum IMI 349063]OBR14377.1 hypothetical protein CH63R_03103 [Colletotrichum higginsianum IMI 349063]
MVYAATMRPDVAVFTNGETRPRTLDHIVRRPTTPLGWGWSGPPPPPPCASSSSRVGDLGVRRSDIVDCVNEAAVPSQSPPPASLVSLFGGPCDNCKQSSAKPSQASPFLDCYCVRPAERRDRNPTSQLRLVLSQVQVCHPPPITPFPRSTFSARYGEFEIRAMILSDEASLSLPLEEPRSSRQPVDV